MPANAAEDVADCCVCGEWADRKKLKPFDSSLLHARCKGQLNTTLNEKHICWRCSRKCLHCSAVVTMRQQLFRPVSTATAMIAGLCEPCFATVQVAKKRRLK